MLKTILKLAAATLICLISYNSASAKSVLDEEYSLVFKNITIVESLEIIEKKAEVIFTYNPDLFESYELINRSFHRAPLRNILGYLLGENIAFETVRERHIILFELKKKKPTLNNLTNRYSPFSNKEISIPESELIKLFKKVRQIKDSVNIINEVVFDTTNVTIFDTVIVEVLDTVKYFERPPLNEKLKPGRIRKAIDKPDLKKSKRFFEFNTSIGKIIHMPNFRVQRQPSLSNKFAPLGRLTSSYMFRLGIESQKLTFSTGGRISFFEGNYNYSYKQKQTLTEIINDTTGLTITPKGILYDIKMDTITSTRDVAIKENISNKVAIINIPLGIAYQYNFNDIQFGISVEIGMNFPTSKKIDLPRLNDTKETTKLMSPFLNFGASFHIAYKFRTTNAFLISPFVKNNFTSIYDSSISTDVTNMPEYGVSIGYRKYL